VFLVLSAETKIELPATMHGRQQLDKVIG